MRWTSLIATLLLAGGLAYWFVLRHGPEATVAASVATPRAETAAPAEDLPVPVIVIESVAQEKTARLVLRGRTAANRKVDVAAETTGPVMSEPLRRGARVSEGQVLCRLDPGVRAAELAEAEAALEEAVAEVDAATQLESKGFAAATTLKAQRAQFRAAEARLDRILWDIAQLEILAPFDGVLESDTAEIGSLLAPGAICATVIDLSKVKVSAFVGEQDVDRLEVGQTATARLINGMVVEGTISFLSRSADPETRTFLVEVTLDNPDGRIRDGMTAELAVDLKPRRAHAVPQSALTLDDAGRLGVRIDDGGIARFVAVTILDETARLVWVSGLPDRATVIVVGQDFVRDGRRVVGSPARQSQ